MDEQDFLSIPVTLMQTRDQGDGTTSVWCELPDKSISVFNIPTEFAVQIDKTAEDFEMSFSEEEVKQYKLERFLKN